MNSKKFIQLTQFLIDVGERENNSIRQILNKNIEKIDDIRLMYKKYFSLVKERLYYPNMKNFEEKALPMIVFIKEECQEAGISQVIIRIESLSILKIERGMQHPIYFSINNKSINDLMIW